MAEWEVTATLRNMIQNIYSRSSVTEYHGYTLMYTVLEKIVKRDELKQFIESSDIASAIRSLPYKPLGLYLSKLLTTSISLEKVDKILGKYLTDMTTYIYSSTPLKHYKVIVDIEKPYDLLNLCIMYTNIREGRRAYPLFPGGIIYTKNIEVRDKNDIIDIMKKLELIHKLEQIVKEGGTPDLIFLKGFVELKKIYFLIQDIALKKVYGLIYDYSLIKGLSSLPKKSIEQVTVSPFFVDKEIIDWMVRESSSTKDIIRYFVKQDPVLENIYRTLSTFIRGFTALDFSHVIYLATTTNNLIKPYTPQPCIRALLVIRGEVIFARLSIMSMLNLVDKDLVKSLINEWWIP